ncbi:RNA-binding S4 domain-containing protein [Sphingobium sp. B2]|uniref:RNA-binding S4 domain-containing protein n=1 Tax=Sphingobium sp. B2 TaxID=2583228 RepID=UPI0011A32D2A|nr:RNA-binding S4 domain-containing protein [Sphingobium sp. B2]
MADPVAVGGHGPTLRIDKYLWFVRLCPTRSSAQKLAEDGHIRVNGRRIERAHAAIRVGDLITFPHGQGVRVVRVAQLPVRRGPALEAQRCYEELTVGG